MPKIILPYMCYWVPMPSHKLTKITLTIPTEQRDWLKDHPEIDVSKLFQQAISNQMMKASRKVQIGGKIGTRLNWQEPELFYT